jgi:cytochrome c553
MSAIAEIEAAIERLPDQDLEQLAQWVETLRIRRSTPQSVDAWLQRARGALAGRASTDQIMSLTRDEA